ncbi:MAG: hypothetical protein LDLANPLL_01448 [Turneriella sp.]|nr:hypothetical protein [Turneriella sp.]
MQSDLWEDYLKEIPGVCEFSTPYVATKIKKIKAAANTPYDRAKLAFKVARDEIQHSFDTQSKVITISAEEALTKKEGICFAKSHLLAALLRGMGIPAGFCYQRVLRKGTVDSGYALHGLNALYLSDTGWFRVDPRGNKPGIDSRFSPEIEKLAYPIRHELGEVDYPDVFPSPLSSVLTAMQTSKDCHDLFSNRPQELVQ